MKMIKEEIIKVRDNNRKAGLRSIVDCCNMLLSKIQTYEKSGKQEIIADDNAVISILQKYKKQVNEEIEFATKQNLLDKIGALHLEIIVIDSFLPKQISDDDLQVLIESVRSELADNKGKIIGRVKQLTGGTADGKRINEMVNKVIHQ